MAVFLLRIDIDFKQNKLRLQIIHCRLPPEFNLMWKFLKQGAAPSAAEEEQEFQFKPDLNQLNQNRFACGSCHSVFSLPDYSSLSIVNCPKCGNSLYVPYLLKNYWLYLPLGGGGMGSVYRAVAKDDPAREYALKVLPRDRRHNPRLIEALLTEASVAKSFGRHAHLAYVEDFGEDKDEFYCAMEFIAGERLDQLIESPAEIDEKYILLWALQMLSAEQRIFDCGFLYRDLKPQNIIIDPDGNAHLIDFGLCLSLEEAGRENDSGKAPGSPIYMPPERIVGEPEGMSGELYSLGMLLFHALTKKTYYNAADALDLAKKHVVGVRMASVATRLSPSLDSGISKILDRLIARLPEDRYQDYKEAAAAIFAVYNKL